MLATNRRLLTLLFRRSSLFLRAFGALGLLYFLLGILGDFTIFLLITKTMFGLVTLLSVIFTRLGCRANVSY